MTGKKIVEAISEQTRMPLSMVITLIGLVAVLVLWGKGLEARVEDHIVRDDEDGKAREAKIEKTQEMFYSIDRRLARIEGALKIEK